ncbi:LacI family DNA-binding transcriptional regulator [Streptomyces bicolor]|uniref:LacI family DNA-binding transcriptional regulator n=1 Tax=Streptomyces bicolor TaxID=66874 RepID=UPI00068C2A63|nr:LacI family DNA-binding transcriptional regulator [Streptomyces bicolor]
MHDLPEPEGIASPGRQPTIYDVAAEAGVAPSTVSRAFSRPGRVNSQTAQRILAAAERLGYRANPPTRPPLPQRSRMIAVVVADIANPCYSPIIRGAEEAADSAGYTVVLSDTRESGRREREALERVVPAVDGIVVSGSRVSDSALRMTAKQKPMVMLNRSVAGLPSVVIDNGQGARSAIEHLRALGHDALIYVAGPEESWADGIRWRALVEAAQELCLKVRRVGPFRPTVDGGIEAADVVATLPASAVVAYNDLLAIGVISGLARKRVRVPHDISVVGFDNIQLSRLLTPGLTTVVAPLHDMGAIAVRTLVRCIAGADFGQRPPLIVPTRLVVRATTAPRSRKRALPTPEEHECHRPPL